VAFEEARWARRIDDPLPPGGDVAAKERLEFTIWRLNRHQENKLVRFFGDGSGEGICWLPICRAIGERLETRSRTRLE